MKKQNAIDAANAAMEIASTPEEKKAAKEQLRAALALPDDDASEDRALIREAAKVIKNPAVTKTIEGEIMDITEPIIKNGKEFRFIIITDFTGAQHRVITSDKQLEGFKIGTTSYLEAFTPGMQVKLTVEERIEGKTQYLKDQTDPTTLETHSQSGIALRTISPLAAFELEGKKKSYMESLETERLSARYAAHQKALRAMGYTDEQILSTFKA